MIPALFAVLGMVAHAQDTGRTQPVQKPPSSGDILKQYMESITQRLPQKVRAALARIPDTRRRLLAMKYYLRRSEEEIERKWAWTDAEAKAFRETMEFAVAVEEIAKVKRAFAEMYPGYQLRADMEIRSLGSQIGKWNGVRSIGIAAAEVMSVSLDYIADSIAAPGNIDSATGVMRFIDFIRAFEPKQVPTVAVPGLSQHGQLRAFDFRIMRGGRMVAGISSRSIPTAWDKAGWTAKLCAATEAASSRFEGPLADPYEPWHYEYRGWGSSSQ